MRQATAAVAIEVRSLGDLARPCELDDPEGIAVFDEAKLHAFQSNPFRVSVDDPAQVLALVNGRVVGRVDVFRGEATAFDERVPLLWGSALHVAAQHRRTGAGAMLVLRMSSLAPTVAGFGFSQAAIPVYRALRWSSFAFPRWILLRRSRPVIEQSLARVSPALRRPAVRIASAGADGLLAASRMRRRLRHRARDGLAAREVDALPRWLDAHLARPAVDFSTRRSSTFVQWVMGSQFSDDPSVAPHRRLFVVENEAGELAGYFLVKAKRYEVASQRGYRNVLLGSLVDWFALDDGGVDLASIVLLATGELLRMGVDAVEVCETETAVARAVRGMGFRRVGETHFMFRARRGSPLAAAAASDRSAWRLTPVEGDGAFG